VVLSAAGAGVEGEMIYAIRAVGTDFIKFGYTEGKSYKRRVETLQTGCPYELEELAMCEGDMKAERMIHHRLFQAGAHYRGEWFKDCDEARMIIADMLLGCLEDEGAPVDPLRIWNRKVNNLALAKDRKPGGWSEPDRQSRVGAEPALSPVPTEGMHDRLERIKQRALARKAAKRSQEAA
jgi:hypothetical protein